MTTSETNKIKKEILAASEVAKCKLCRYLIGEMSSWYSKYFSSEQKNHFLDLCEARDFEAATGYFVNTMLPRLRSDQQDYQTVLILCKSNLVVVHDIAPNSKDVIDQAIAESNYYGILKGLHAFIKKASFTKGLDNVLYLLWEVARRPKGDVPAGVKHCVFHLLAQYMASRRNGKMTKLYALDTLIYLQDKYHCFDESDPLEMAVLQGTIHQNDFKPDWQSFMNSEGLPTAKRLTIEDILARMDQMDEAHADLVHYLFMSHHIDYQHYPFRDEWMIDAYVEVYNAYYGESRQYLSQLNRYVIDILKEWKQDDYNRYLKARRAILYWMEDPIPAFTPTLGADIQQAYDTAIKTEKPDELAKVLMPFPKMIYEQVKAKDFEAAAGNIYCIFEYLGAANKAHEQWFDTFWDGVELTPLVLFTEVVMALYCHLRQLRDLPEGLKNEMDCHLDILNKKTSLFGDGFGDSRIEDMFRDGKKQSNDYSELEACYMWSDWYLAKILSTTSNE